MRQVLTLLLCLGWSAVVGATDLPAQVHARLLDTPLLRGEFQQSKTVAGFRKPLQSTGDFVLSRSEGVLWHTRHPFASTLVLTRDRVLSKQADGTTMLRLDAGEQPAVRAINELLFGLLQGDVAKLSQQFRIDGAVPDRTSWQLLLTPTDPTIARMFLRIELQGDRHVRQVRFEEANGDATLIRFEHLATTPPLSDAERKAFE